MDRRTFAGLLGGLGIAAPGASGASDRRTRFYRVESFQLKAGAQLPRLHEFFSKNLVPKMNGIWGGPKLFLEAVVAAHLPQVISVYGFNSLEEMWSVHGKILADQDLGNAFEAWESGSEPAYETASSMLLEAAPYSPEIAPAAFSKPRIFELRVYHSPTYRQLAALHERFSGPEIKIFHRVGIHPVLYSSTLIGPDLPNLTYLIPFDSLADREKAWAAFSADPEWVKVRKESIDRHGQISSVQNVSLLKATDYSPVK